MNIQDLKDHQARAEEIEQFLEKKAREFDDLMGDNKARGSIDGWELWGDHLSVTFYETWRYGGEGRETITLPIDILEKDITEAAAEAKAKRGAEAAARKERQAQQDQETRRRQFENLKKEFG